MKQCPECRRTYADETLFFCLEDGSPLTAQFVPAPTESYVPAVTERIESPRNYTQTSAPTFQINSPPTASAARRGKFWIIPAAIAVLLALVGGGIVLVLVVKHKSGKSPDSNIHTVASNAVANDKPTVSPTETKPPSFKLVGTWEADVK